MTFREKFHEDFPEKKDFNPASKWCPSAFDYETDWTCNPTDYRIIGCGPEGLDCDKCWDREMPDRNQAPYFIIEIEPFMQSNDLRQDISEAEKSLNDKTVQKYMERLINFKENESEELIEVRSKGLNSEERIILMEAMRRALQGIICHRRKDGRSDIQSQAVLE